MKKNNFLLFLVSLALSSFPSTSKGYFAEAYFGIYGIQHQSDFAGYQQYVGQTVKYLPSKFTGKEMISYRKDDGFLRNGGSFEKEYLITKITVKNNRLTFHLKEKEGKKVIKLDNVLTNEKEPYSSAYDYCITENYSIPLFLIDKFNADKSKYEGTVYPKQNNGSVQMEVSELTLQKREIGEEGNYPAVFYVLKDKASGETYYADPSFDLNDIGKEFTNPKFKCTYHVISGETEKSSKDNELTMYYIVKNSLDGTTKRVLASNPSLFAFMGDDGATFMATLSKVEKPSNPEIRYGETTTISDKDITKFSYVDNIIDILIFASNTEFQFILNNISDNSIKVIWNEAVFVDVDGSTSKVMHKGIKYSQREADQPASVIIRGAKLEDVATPIDKVYYSEALKNWTSKSLFLNAQKDQQGQTIKLMLPIQVMDVVNEYIFEFDVKYVLKHPEYLAD